MRQITDTVTLRSFSLYTTSTIPYHTPLLSGASMHLCYGTLDVRGYLLGLYWVQVFNILSPSHIITKCEKTFQRDYENGDQSCSILVPFWGW